MEVAGCECNNCVQDSRECMFVPCGVGLSGEWEGGGLVSGGSATIAVSKTIVLCFNCLKIFNNTVILKNYFT